MKVTLKEGDYGTWILVSEDGRERLIQTDWDFPGLASHLGWVPCSQCDATDGTIACAHRTVSEMIKDAISFLDDHEGESFEDPGYFDEEG